DGTGRRSAGARRRGGNDQESSLSWPSDAARSTIRIGGKAGMDSFPGAFVMRNNSAHDRLDRVTSERLAKLAARPVDTSRLEQRLEAAMREAVVEDAASTRPIATIAAWQRWWRPITSAAAAILIVVTIGWLALDG